MAQPLVIFPPFARPMLPRLEIFIDGSNFRLAQIQSNSPPISIPRLARQLARGHVLVKLRYYTAPLPNFDSEAYRGQQRFFDLLRASRSIELVLGRHEARFDREGRKYHVEKETDVNLAVDMVVGAFRDQYDVAMLVGSDSDFVRAITAVREEGRRVVWCHMETHGHNHHLRQVCDSTFPLTEKFLRTCR